MWQRTRSSWQTSQRPSTRKSWRRWTTGWWCCSPAPDSRVGRPACTIRGLHHWKIPQFIDKRIKNSNNQASTLLPCVFSGINSTLDRCLRATAGGSADSDRRWSRRMEEEAEEEGLCCILYSALPAVVALCSGLLSQSLCRRMEKGSGGGSSFWE